MILVVYLAWVTADNDDNQNNNNNDIPTTHSIDHRHYPVVVYQKVPFDVPSPMPVLVPNYLKVQV